MPKTPKSETEIVDLNCLKCNKSFKGTPNTIRCKKCEKLRRNPDSAKLINVRPFRLYVWPTYGELLYPGVAVAVAQSKKQAINAVATDIVHSIYPPSSCRYKNALKAEKKYLKGLECQVSDINADNMPFGICHHGGE